uniref:GLOBIN domain-containing protein n=1 Tax=Heterorhabditis bacteriophora TaxID=37862 RepID=A0A1I7WAS2_HETBA
MQTMISIMLVVKFLLFRSLTFVVSYFFNLNSISVILDIMEVTIGVNSYYLIDISNFLVLINSATNCLIFLKATSWLNNRWVERKTMKRKKTVCDAGQLFGDRLFILHSSWQQAMRMMNGQLGLRVLYSMLRKHPSLFGVFCVTNPMMYTNCDRVAEPELVSLLTNGNRRSFDIITNTKYQEVADRITSFISELLDLMRTGKPEEYIIMRIRRVGAIHYDKGIQFPSSVWKEFKASTISIISECEFKTQDEREAALEAWNIFISFIIREMKMGTWAIGDTLGAIG